MNKTDKADCSRGVLWSGGNIGSRVGTWKSLVFEPFSVGGLLRVGEPLEVVRNVFVYEEKVHTFY